MALNDKQISSAQYIDKQYKIQDEKGMYLLVTKSGKYFRLDYRFGNKRKTLALGVYDETTLKDARTKRDEAKKLLEQGIDPSLLKQQIKKQIVSDTENTFEALALKCFENYDPRLSKKHVERKWRRLEKHALPYLGKTPIKHITAPMILSVIQKIEKRGNFETAHRVFGVCSEIFVYAIADGLIDRDPTRDIHKVLKPKKTKRMATITDPKKIGPLLKAIDDYDGYYETQCALKLLPLVFVRPGELRHMEWDEIDFEEKLWTIPPEKMKMQREHIVPLSVQTLEIIKDIQQITGQWKYVFPSIRSKDRPMSDNTINAAIRRLGYTKEELTGHGFRSMASTLLNEKNWPSDHVEVQLAHVDGSVRGIYNSAIYLESRIKMMQWWADYLDELKTNTKNN
ncbi:MAG: tyrosine-type recombinase/integrase [Deferribacterales bacterium]